MNRNAGMKWMNESFDKRINPELVLEDVRSVISLAYLYDTPVAHPENRNIPKISRYAWGERDYHKVIKKKLKILCAKIESVSPDIKTRYYIDDGPVMDKSWAVRSGIGWMGKHTNVINPEIGSYFFLQQSSQIQNCSRITELKIFAGAVISVLMHVLPEQSTMNTSLMQTFVFHIIQSKTGMRFLKR